MSKHLDDFRKPDGTTDYDAYYAAQAAIGYRCSQCRGIEGMSGVGKGEPEKCPGCQKIDEAGELWHHALIRCPNCRATSPAIRMFGNPSAKKGIIAKKYLAAGARAPVVCPACKYKFTVSVYVSYDFVSPVASEKAVEILQPENVAA